MAFTIATNYPPRVYWQHHTMMMTRNDVRRIPIEGMHCRSCELLIEKNLSSVSGVEKVSVSHKTGIALIETRGAILDERLVRKAIEDAGYKIGSGAVHKPWLATDFATYAELLIAAGIVFIVFVAAYMLGLFDLSFEFGQSPKLPIILLVGLTAGVSTCMALVGGLVLGVSARYAELHPEATATEKMRPHFAFNLGRIASFALLGGLIGLVGSAFTVSGVMLGLLIVVVGAVMTWLGLKLTDVFPRLSEAGFGLPGGIGRALGLNKEAGEYSHRGAFTTGALTFFLPCGFTQAMQIYAVSTGSFTQGALIMSIFAIGTAPGLLGIGGLTSAAKGSWGKIFFKIVGVAVIALGMLNIQSGLNLAGVGLPSFGGAEAQSAVVEEGGVQIVRMEQKGNGYYPNRFTVKKNMPVRWVIDSTNPYTCAAFLVVPEYRISKNLQKGENVIEFTPTETGSVRFSCSMGMYAGSFDVVE